MLMNRQARVSLLSWRRFFRNADDSRLMKIVLSVCGGCGGRVFFVLVDDVEGEAERACVGCGGPAFIADCAEFWEDAGSGSYADARHGCQEERG
ncbi:hypothetical protein ACIPJS_39435 [Streptomyces sp. NPDC086783]|uniref:hypothetical protein n=1 Tax=Streptomyces sp. NPDC086783 TaxID=3365758 RepID=UPI003829EF09